MKRIISFLLVGVLLAACVMMSGCKSGGGKDSAKTENYTDAKGHKLDSAIIGKWSHDEQGVAFVYDFKEDGTGTYDAGGTTIELEYYTEKGKISIKFGPDEEYTVLDYEIEGDTLNVKDSFGGDTLYNKV